MTLVAVLHRVALSAVLACPAWMATAPLRSATAQVCCPSGCVQNGGGCQQIGLLKSCPTIGCGQPPPPPPRPGGSAGRGAPGVTFGIRPTYDACQRPPGYMPPGSFRKTCNEISFRCGHIEDTLTAVCRSGQGLRRSTLPDASICVDVRNDNGLLKCHKRIRRVV